MLPAGGMPAAMRPYTQADTNELKAIIPPPWA
jgi:hypothetical protein